MANRHQSTRPHHRRVNLVEPKVGGADDLQREETPQKAVSKRQEPRQIPRRRLNPM
jgi:hypothetical protein